MYRRFFKRVVDFVVALVVLSPVLLVVTVWLHFANKGAGALAFPSYREGFPNVVMQAGAMGLPSIVTDINGCNEIVVDGKNGRIIKPQDVDGLRDMMLWFIEHPTEVAAMAANAREMIVSRYQRQLIWDELLKVYQSATSAK